MRRVLAVDDNPSILAAVQEILENSGYLVMTVASGAEALGRIETESFDLVVTDLRMPGMSGRDLIARLRGHRAYRDVPILILAVGAAEADLGGLQVDARIPKPFEPETLVAAVSALIG